MFEAVERSVGGSPALLAGFPGAGGRYAIARVIEVSLARAVPIDGEIDGRDQLRQSMPERDAIDHSENGAQQPLQQPWTIFKSVIFTRHLPRPRGRQYRHETSRRTCDVRAH